MAIVVKDLEFKYSPKSPFEKHALKGVSVQINEGDFLGIIGHTGSGKSTFIQHLNGLILAQSGDIRVFDIDLSAVKKKRRFKAKKEFKMQLRRLRGEVGMVFQYPEYQLFEDTVAKDIAYGPKNIGVPKEEIEDRVREAVELVGLDYEEIKDRSPFDLSGGQKRRVAIAGVIAMRPKVLILDEPTAGLDPRGKEQILELIVELKQKCSPTVIVISHDMDEVTRFSNRIIVFNQGKIAYDTVPERLYLIADELTSMGLDIPVAVKLSVQLRQKGVELGTGIVTPDDFVNAVLGKYRGVNKDA